MSQTEPCISSHSESIPLVPTDGELSGGVSSTVHIYHSFLSIQQGVVKYSETTCARKENQIVEQVNGKQTKCLFLN